MDFLKELGIDTNNIGVCSGNGEWLKSSSSTIISSESPANQEVIAKVSTGNAEHYEKVVTDSLAAFNTWRTVPAPKRGEVVRQLSLCLREKKSALGSLVALEMGKSKQEGDGEVQEMIDMADLAVGQARMLYGSTMHSERPEHRMYEQWHPLGPVGVISAFNFPVAVWAWNAFLAAIAGDTVIWKPSSKTPLCAVAVQHICNQVMQESAYPGIFSLFIPESRDIAEAMLHDKRLPLISFTGSTPVGKHVSEVVGKRLGRSLLELAGNNAIIVDESADLNIAIPAIVFGAVGTAGQRCTSTRRLIVHESIHDSLLETLAHAYGQITIGDPLDKKNLMGPLIDEAAKESYVSAISRIRELGGEILFGGEVIDRPGHFVQPALVAAEADWDIVGCETFVPILYGMKYRDLDKAIALQNSVDQGLSSAIFTQNVLTAERFLAAIGSDCGIANINIGTSGAEIGGAFGGEKDTGGGREAGSDAWKTYMRRQTNTINWSKELPLAQGIEFNIDI